MLSRLGVTRSGRYLQRSASSDLYDAEQFNRVSLPRENKSSVCSQQVNGESAPLEPWFFELSHRANSRRFVFLVFASQKHAPMPTQSNRFLTSLSAKCRRELIARSTLVDLNLRDVIAEAGIVPKFAYLPLSGVVSEVVRLSDGDVVEIGLVGFEGVTGTYHLLGTSKSLSRTFVQVGGEAYCLPFRVLKELFVTSPDVHKAVLQYVQHQITHLGQTAACNRVHDAGPRFARWLLTVQDRSSVDEFALTHEFLAQMLGTGRPTISLISKLYEKRKLIGHNRGKIRIVDRPGLEAVACACYEATRGTLLELYR